MGKLGTHFPLTRSVQLYTYGMGKRLIAKRNRVEDMSNRKNRFKVDINAQENHLTGVGLITDDFSVIVVEGTSKAVRRYDKLMMRRIDWNASLNEHDDMEVDEHTKNKCTRVWKGTSTTHALKRFTFETLSSEAAARNRADANKDHAVTGRSAFFVSSSPGGLRRL